MIILTGCAENAPITTDPSGIWDTIVYFLAQAIIFFGRIFGNNIGWGIVITTIIFRVVMIPFYRKQLQSTEEMSKIKPEIDKITAKYKGKSDQDSKLKQQQEMSALYKRHGVNPLAGCLPMLLQFPLLLMYYDAIQGLLLNGLYTEPVQTAEQGLINLGAGDMAQTFLTIDLASPALIMAILAALTTYLSTKLSMMGQKTPQNSENKTADMMKPMLIIMPIMILFMGLSLPSSLSLYWVTGNIMMILQTIFFKRHVLFDRNINKISNN